MKIVAAIVLVLVAFVAALAWFAPATLVDRQLDAATGGKLRLSDAQGTLWTGRGILTSPGSSWRVPVAFSVARDDVVRGVYRVALLPVDGATSPRGTVELVGGGGVRVRDLAVEVPAAALGTAIPARGLPTAGGALAITATTFDWTPAGKSGALDARWKGARLVVGDTVADLGNVELTMTPRQDALTGRLANNGGDVRIDGNVSISAAGAISVDATIAPAPSAPAVVVGALAAIGTPGTGGAVRVAWRGALR